MKDAENVIELSNIEIYEHCMLNLNTGKKTYNKEKKQINSFTGLYFKDENTFFALYPTENGPIMYYEGKKYPLKKDLDIRLVKEGKLRKFLIREYNICIQYNTSPYIDFDVWSGEEDVDLFYQIFKQYRNEEYYKMFTK